MKRSIFMLFALSFIIGFGPAQAQNKIVVGDVTGDPGADVTVNITVTSDKNVAGASFTVLFDQTKLQIKTADKGADAAAMTPVGVDVAAANSDGSLEVSLVDFSFSNPVAAGADKELYVVTFTIDAAASGEIPVELDAVSLSDESAGDIAVDIVNGVVTAGGVVPPGPEPPAPTGNAFWITDAEGEAGSDVTVKMLATTDKNVAGASFTLLFDQTKLQINAADKGADAAAMTPVGVDVAAANSDGSLEVSLVDFSFANPIAAGENKEVYVVTFTIDAAASGEISVELDGVSLSDESAGDIAVTVTEGTVTVSGEEPGPGPAPEPEPQEEPEGNYILIQDAFGDVGTEVTMPVIVTSDKNVAGISFIVEFEPSKMQISAADKGADASAMSAVGLDVEGANTSGELAVSLVDFSFANPVPAGEKKEVFVVTFSVAAAGAIPVSLSGVSLSDESAGDIAVTIVDGTVNKEPVGPGPAVEPGDVDGDGVVNIFDLLGLLQVLSGAGEPSAGSDANSDGTTNIFDLLALLGILADG